MNLPSTVHDQDAFPAKAASSNAATTKTVAASVRALPVPSANAANAATAVTPAATSGVSASLPSRSSSLYRAHTIKGKPSTSQTSLPDSTMTAQVLPTHAPAFADHSFLERSPSPHTRASTHNAMVEAMTTGRSPSLGRSPSFRSSPGIIRRLSRGASNRLRRRASTQHSLRLRDPSAGPTLIRRRSDSNGASDMGEQVSDLELDSTTEDVIEDTPYPSSLGDHHNALGISLAGRPGAASSSTVDNAFEGGIAPANSAVLEAGTWLTKLTKRRQKRIRLWLDSNSARVCWHSSNPSKSFFIDDVREVRIGVESRNARDDVQVLPEHEGRWVTIVYDVPERSKGRAIKTMHVLMPDDYLLGLWTNALNTVTRERIEIMNALSSNPEKSDRSVSMAWHQVMTRKTVPSDGRFALDDARWLCRKLEINCSESAVRTHFRSVTSDETAGLDYEQYKHFVQSFRERKDIQHIYRNMKYGTQIDMDLETFMEFLKREQMVDAVKERSHWESVFDKYARPTKPLPSSDKGSSLTHRTLSMQGFQSFLTSSHSTPLKPLKSEPTLDRPLNEYYISSSHNTYLLGRQVAGASSVEGYIAALVKGCRCIEIDCWNGDNGRPMVTHGFTMTTRIPFEDCVSVIAKYAFNSSPYPLIVSLEVHCSSVQQVAMVGLMKKYFGDMMVTETLNSNTMVLPSPEELKNKILIKVKASEGTEQNPMSSENAEVGPRPDGSSRAQSLTAFSRTSSVENQSAMSSPSLSASAATSFSESYPLLPAHGSVAFGPMATPSSSADDSDEIPPSSEKSKKPRKTTRITHELGKLGVYTQGIKFTGFEAQDAKLYNHIYSLAENQFDRLCAKNTDNKALLESHNLRHLMRVYPGAKRVDSSNFNPLQSWRRGVQMAALNWQTYDVHQQVNEAMFAAGSDRLGYVLKPEELRHAKHQPIAGFVSNAAGGKEKKGKKLVKFSVDIISAQRLPRPRNQSTEGGMNPYIEFEMYSAEDKARGIATAEGGVDASAPDGSSGIGSPLRKRTRIVDGNGFDPQYNQPITLAVETKYPSLIFVRWTVWNAPEGKKSASNSALLATFTAKLDSLQQGYRHLPLFNPQGEQYRDAKLFVKIRKEAPIALQQEDNASGFTQASAFSRGGEVNRNGWSSTRGSLRGIFSRTPSTNGRRKGDSSSDIAGPLSRTSSMDRDSIN
ncbi:1-phosphatidylinositol 4,5-bisphosphate phosphodiesterase delta-4 [Fulvia fulva]|uniref:Phosphoinositide phospholipase C n=1 Tax=Passalora fulva TaxID=5499 RepID=A0A9Q8L8U5_PASFU|nr:1-phosphatidylinositol 4,5-bisphosphate phosphodiesterase delta-4 [Fulvia fulva]KAK4634618.1 1-phosphatidylinositol 4,5-bisphosphate phosphodiesterase delta-4 [Fulvia fulva]KAK4636715.1 1-phosphatidylinositol 4,5-bisphosphate phosphodiesterase delta-4 [Fulvia fulva]UJO12967.1 1-phosphatidylinositol 4,5-bisphosphate phosphodiesterase delta-4 [Fulvia fulva]WPV09265.1 1-phosphatidylinositol 4,5-bisphosphate phosphodiesterase delta-4 [Fulvia fulva]WPV23936.1 1-phosphatidylinositol 4,5-bisphosph